MQYLPVSLSFLIKPQLDVYYICSEESLWDRVKRKSVSGVCIWVGFNFSSASLAFSKRLDQDQAYGASQQ